MYSLYRAWLSMSNTSSSHPLNLTTSGPPQHLLTSALNNLSAPNGAPDVHLQVGPSLTSFSAHRSVLAAHSGFFKAALGNCKTTSETGIAWPGPILVPNIQVDEFSSLLTFMYTGYLDLNPSNIYNILLATHILHMPRALELCRTFLMQTQPQHQISAPVPPPPIIKPIASRQPLPMILDDDPTPVTNDNTSSSSALCSTLFHTSSVFKKPEVEVPAAAASTSKAPDSPRNDKVKDKPKPKKPRRSMPTENGVVQPAISASDERVIIDIACCDGPVRFHRVINKNYASVNALKTASDGLPSKPKLKQRCTEAAINKVMTENIKMADTTATTPSATVTGEENSPELYTCVYCNHTFKSQYCYQKHARRHLNPVDAVKVAPTTNTSTATATTAEESEQLPKGREFKLLDMNVQYYPCKTCGSKFPSYYFVHKHRKLCHADEMADGTNKNNEIVQVKPKAGAPKRLASATSTAKSAPNDENSREKSCEPEVATEHDRDDGNTSVHMSNASNESCHSLIDVEETND